MPLSSYYHRMMQSWRFRSRLEQVLIGVSTVTMFLALLFLILLINQHKTLEENSCSTPICLIEAAKIVERVDPSVNPCEDFYKFACGNYIKNENEEPLEYMYKRIERQILELYMEPIREDEHYMVKSEKKLFQACMDIRAIRADNLTTIREVIKELGGWPIVEGPQWDETKFDWLQTTYKLRELGYPFGIFLDLSVTTDPRNSSRYILKVSLPFYENGEESSRKEAMTNDALMFGADSKFASKDVDEMYDLEQNLKTAVPGRYRQDLISSDTFMINEIQNKISDFNWLEFINNLSGPAAQISKDNVVIFPLPENLRKWLDIISNASKRTQTNFLIWRMILQMKSYLTVQYRTQKGRAKYCLDLVRERFAPNPMSVIYARKYIPKNKRKSMKELISNTANELIKLLDKIQWLEEDEKQKLKDKAKHLTVVIGKDGDYFDDKTLDDMNVDMRNVSNENFLNLLSQANRNYKSQMYSRINKIRDEVMLHHHDMFHLPHLLFYSSQTNVLHIPPIVVQNTIFNENRPNYLNYGAFGTEIGKQLASLFSEVARKSYTVGEKSDGRQAEAEKLGQCIIRNIEDNGMTKNNNIVAFALPAYIVGPKLSYETYRDWVKNNGEEPKLIGIQYTSNQLFWTSTVSCEAGNSFDVASMFMQQYSDHYSHLVNTSLRLHAEFARDFNCPVGSRMNTPNRCDMF